MGLLPSVRRALLWIIFCVCVGVSYTITKEGVKLALAVDEKKQSPPPAPPDRLERLRLLASKFDEMNGADLIEKRLEVLKDVLFEETEFKLPVIVLERENRAQTLLDELQTLANEQQTLKTAETDSSSFFMCALALVLSVVLFWRRGRRARVEASAEAARRELLSEEGAPRPRPTKRSKRRAAAKVAPQTHAASSSKKKPVIAVHDTAPGEQEEPATGELRHDAPDDGECAATAHLAEEKEPATEEPQRGEPGEDTDECAVPAHLAEEREPRRDAPGEDVDECPARLTIDDDAIAHFAALETAARRREPNTNNDDDCAPARRRHRADEEEEPAFDYDVGNASFRGDDERLCCVVCLEVEKTHLFIPCGHKSACARCAAAVMATTKLCPMCRERSDATFRVFE